MQDTRTSQGPVPADTPSANTPPTQTPTRRPRREASPPPRRRRNNPASVYIILVILSAIFIGPIFWLILAALKTREEWAAVPAKILPGDAQWGNFVHALTDINFPAYTMNSLFLSTLYATLITLSSAMVGFGFARLRAPGKRAMFLILLSTMMMPQVLTLLPTYVLFSRIGLINTYWPWVMWGLAASPFLVFMFRQFFAALPRELEDAAIIDGSGWGRIFFQIFLPLSRPVLITGFLTSFTWSWGDYIAPALLLDVDRTTLAVAISAWYQDPRGNPMPTVQAAAAGLYILPVMLIFLFAQRHFIRSVVTSGVKG